MGNSNTTEEEETPPVPVKKEEGVTVVGVLKQPLSLIGLFGGGKKPAEIAPAKRVEAAAQLNKVLATLWAKQREKQAKLSNYKIAMKEEVRAGNRELAAQLGVTARSLKAHMLKIGEIIHKFEEFLLAIEQGGLNVTIVEGMRVVMQEVQQQQQSIGNVDTIEALSRQYEEVMDQVGMTTERLDEVNSNTTSSSNFMTNREVDEFLASEASSSSSSERVAPAVVVAATAPANVMVEVPLRSKKKASLLTE